MENTPWDFSPVNNCILYGYRGSIAHNMFIPPEEEFSTDDVDLMGLCIAPLKYYYGLDKFEQSQISEGKDDIIVYDIRKFFRLLLKGNPNVLSFIWNDESMFLKINPLGKKLLENKEMFSSKYAFKSFHGYAKSQLHKMEKNGVYQGYMGTKRKVIVDKFGYDVKNASHLIRLLRMGIEFLLEQRMTVFREKDRNELIDIKQGKWSLERVKTEANKLFLELEDAEKVSKLPEKPDAEAINNLLMEIMTEHFKPASNCASF